MRMQRDGLHILKSMPSGMVRKDDEKIYTHIVSNTAVPQLATFVKAVTACDADAFATASLLLPEADLLCINQSEQVEFAHFNPRTNEFWSTVNF